jgi:hypothetical protein
MTSDVVFPRKYKPRSSWRSLGAGVVALTLASPALTGCDKLKSAMNKGDEGGAPTADPAAASLAILNGFEGEIGVMLKGKDLKASQPINLTLDVKGDKWRADVPPGMEGTEKMGHAYGIFDGTAKKIFFVMDQSKQVIVIDLSKTGEQLKGMKPGMPGPGRPSAGAGAPSDKPSYPPKVTKTGKTDKVAGYGCEIWTFESTDPAEKGKAEVCIANQGTSWFHIPMTGIPAEYSFMSEIVDGNHFPLRFIGYDAAGVEQGRAEVTKIDKKTLDAAMFVPPAAYAQMDLGAMLGGGMMGPGMMGPGAMGPHGPHPMPGGPGFPHGIPSGAPHH